MDPAIFTSVLSIVLTLYIFSFIILLILENRDPDKTIAWILIVAFIPILGLFIYFYLGQNWKKKQFIQHFQTKTLHSIIKQKAYYAKKILSDTAKKDIGSMLEKKIINTVQKTTDFGITSRNNMRFFFKGGDKFDELVKQIRMAKKYVHIEYYRIHDDIYGRVLKKILLDKANDGVEVRLLLDFYGSLNFLRKYTNELRRGGVNVHSFFNPFRLFQYHKLNYRNHRKIVIIDGKKAFIGGMNIGVPYVSGGKRFRSWRDMHVMVEGEAVHQLQTIFIYDWYLARKENIIDDKYYPKLSKKNLKHKVLQSIYSGPEQAYEPIKQLYFLLITNTKKEIKICSPYFIPDESTCTALKNASLSGVKVKLIMPSKPDHHVPFFASRTYFEELMKAGVEIYQYGPGFLHAKCILVDGTVATLGTANFDIRGFQMNFESNIIMYSKQDVEIVEQEIDDIIVHSKKLDLEKFKKRKISMKVRESFCRLLSPVL
ncbi:cardiolipin synthase [Candidatus Woesearchaeota archaeon]|nr:cardiolipin synthase [Candidatus Woesearchaeota archaeon]